MIDFNQTNYTEKEKNILVVLDYIIEAGETSGIDTAKATGISAATVSRVINVLKDRNLIAEVGKERISGMGRPPELYCLNPNYGHLLFYYVGSDKLECILADFSGREVAQCYSDIDRNISPGEFCRKLKACALSLVRSIKADYESILFAGISIPGMVDEQNHVIKRIPNFSNFNNVNMEKSARDILKMPVFIVNEARLSAVGEAIANYNTYSNLIYLDFTRFSGIGAGIISNGKLLCGKNGLAGEIGDMLVDPYSFYRDYSNNEGCLEAMAGVGGMYSKLQSCINNGRANILKEILEMNYPDGINLRAIEEAVLMQDMDVSDIFDETIKIWAVAAVNLITVLDPDVLILGGVVGSENDVVLAKMTHYLSKAIGYNIDIRLGSADSYKIGGIQMLKKRSIERIITQALKIE